MMSKMTILFDEQLRIVPFIIMPEEFHHRVSALRQDYYQGILSLGPVSTIVKTQCLESSDQDTLRLLVKELKNPGLDPTRREKILDRMQQLLKTTEKK